MGGRKKSKKHVEKPEFFRLANAGLTTGFATDVAAWTLQFQGDNTWGDIAVVQPPQPTGHDWDSTSPTSNSASSGNTTRVTSPDNELRQSSNLEKLVWPKKDSVTVVSCIVTPLVVHRLITTGPLLDQRESSKKCAGLPTPRSIQISPFTIP